MQPPHGLRLSARRGTPPPGGLGRGAARAARPMGWRPSGPAPPWPRRPPAAAPPTPPRDPAPPRPPPTATTTKTGPLRFAALAAGIAGAAAAALALAAGTDPSPLADALLFGGDPLDEAAGAGPPPLLRPGLVAGALLWAAALRLVSLPQLALLFIGRVDGARPVEAVERLLSLAAGPDGPTTPAALAAVRGGAAAVFLAGGAGVAALLAWSLGGDDTWAVASGLGALAAGGLCDLGRPPRAPRALSPGEADAAAARAAAFAAWADAGALRRGGQCYEGDVLAAARRPGGPARGWSDDEARAALRAWAMRGGGRGRPPSRSAAGFWKGVAVVPGGGGGGTGRVGVADLAPPRPPRAGG